MTLAVVLMGVSGCGKTSIGRKLSDELGWTFYEGDDFHPAKNVEKMSNGRPLSDKDRAPWLQSLHDLIAEHILAGEPLVLACSALKRRYREQLREGNEGLVFVHLQGDFDLIWSRMQARKGHYMKPHMLESQFHALEPPVNALLVSIDKPVSVIVEEIIQFIELELGSGQIERARRSR